MGTRSESRGYCRGNCSWAADRRLLAEAAFRRGIWDSRQGRLPSAYETWQTALPGFETVGRDEEIANCQCNLGILYKDLGWTEEAKIYLEQALNTCRELEHGAGAGWLWRGSGLELGGLLLGLLAAGLMLEEFVDTPDQRYLPAVLGLLTVVQEEITTGKDVFAALAATLPRLTNPAVKRAVQETFRAAAS